MLQFRIWRTSHCFTGALSIHHQINSHSRAMLPRTMEWPPPSVSTSPTTLSLQLSLCLCSKNVCILSNTVFLCSLLKTEVKQCIFLRSWPMLENYFFISNADKFHINKTNKVILFFCDVLCPFNWGRSFPFSLQIVRK